MFFRAIRRGMKSGRDFEEPDFPGTLPQIVLGYVFHSHRSFLDASVRHLRSFAVLAVILFPLSAVLSGLDNSARGGSAELHLYAVLANALCTWALIYCFIGAALRFLDRQAPWIEYISQSSYWVFLVHMPLVSLAGWWLIQFDLPAVLKFALVCAFTSVVALASFHYWVQNTWISTFLHGRRFSMPWPWQKPGMPA